MPSLSRARIVKYHMGLSYYIYWDELYRCFRVMQRWSPSLYQNSERYILVE